MVLKTKGLMMACNKLKLIALSTYTWCCVWEYTGKYIYMKKLFSQLLCYFAF